MNEPDPETAVLFKFSSMGYLTSEIHAITEETAVESTHLLKEPLGSGYDVPTLTLHQIQHKATRAKTALYNDRFYNYWNRPCQ